MRSTPHKDRGNQSPYEIVIGLVPQGPLDAVLEKISPEKLSPSDYVKKLNDYLGAIPSQIAERFAVDHDKRKERSARGGRSLGKYICG